MLSPQPNPPRSSVADPARWLFARPCKLLVASLVAALLLLIAGCAGPGPRPTPGKPVINEVLYFEAAGQPTSSERGHEWIEIHNPGPGDRSLAGWTLQSRRPAPLAQLPAIVLPPGAYLVVHLTSGNNELDFSDGRGDLFVAQPLAPVLDNSQDEVGLFSGPPSAATAVDFINWKADDAAAVVAGSAQQAAVAAGIWQADSFFDSTHFSRRPFERVRTVRAGTSIGRDKNSTDTDVPLDWDAHGGRDALDITPRRRNFAGLALIFPPPPPPPPMAEWTFMVYLDGDNDLEPAAFKDLTEMEQTINSADVNVVVMIDGDDDITEVERAGGNLRPVPGRPRGATWRGQIRRDSDPDLVFIYPAAADAGGGYFLGERNMGDPAELSGFVNWAKANYPARKYALVVWNHGLGWKGVAYDDSSSGDALRIGEIGRAVGGAGVDLIGYDACLMAMIEVANQSAPGAKVMVGSEEVEDFDGWPYDTLLADLKANPAVDAAGLGRIIVNRYAQHYTAIAPDPLFTQSALDLGGNFRNLVTDVDRFAGELTLAIDDIDLPLNAADNEQIDIARARNLTEQYRQKDFVDLSDLASRVDASPLKPRYKTRARPIVDRLAVGAGVVIAERHGGDHPRSNGVSIYFPRFQTKRSGSPPVCGGGGCGAPGNAGDPFDSPATVRDTAGSDPVFYAEDNTTDNGAVPYFGRRPHPRPQAPGFDFPLNTRWDEFLHRYYKPAADSGIGDAYLWGSMVTLDGRGSSDADGDVTRWLWDLHSLRDEPPVIGNGACLGTPEDADCDRIDEANDDPELVGDVVNFQCLEPRYDITLSVHDDHDRQHDNHWKTDQHSHTVFCVPCIKRVEEKFVLPGQVFTWRVEMANPSDRPSEVRFSDRLPAGLKLRNARSAEMEVRTTRQGRIVASGLLPPRGKGRVDLELQLDRRYRGEEIRNRAEYRYGAGKPVACEGRVSVGRR